MLHILIGKLIGMTDIQLKVHFIFEIRIFVTQMVDLSCRPIWVEKRGSSTTKSSS